MRNRQMTSGWIARRRARGRVPGWPQYAAGASLGLSVVLTVLLVAGILGAAALYAGATTNLPSPERLRALLAPGTGLLAQPTRLYDRSGQQLVYALENPGIERRSLWLDPEKAEHFSPLLVQMIVSADDRDFWRHPGVTFESLTSARPVTIAEKLADRFLLDQEPPSWQRSLRLRLLAAQITAHFGRAQVLEWYLNSIPFGHLAYGADSAARLYLGKPATDLSLAETALLIAVEGAPALNPLDSPKAALERQAAVLDLLLQRGYINQQDYLRARAEQLKFQTAAPAPRQPGAAFARLVLNELAGRIGQERLERGGLRVFTTLDYNLQQDLDCAARAQLLHLQGKRATPARADGQACGAARQLLSAAAPDPLLPGDTMAGAVVLDLQKGEVLAYVGAVTAEGQPQTAVYQPGSLLTPFVALAGFARGMGPASLVWDLPGSLPSDLNGRANPDGRFHGPARLRLALVNDYLAPFAQLLERIGARTVWRLSAPLGLRGLDNPGLPKPGELIYAGGNAGLLEIAQAYGTLANGGVQTGSGASGLEDIAAGGGLRPVTVQLVQADDGQVLLVEPGAQSVTVLDAPLAYLVHDILADEAARRSTGGTSDPLEIGRPAAGKLGTADEGRQVWTAGYTPQRVVVAWLGLPGGDAAGKLDERMAAGLWRAGMQSAVKGLPAAGWREPPGISHVNVCNPSGLLPTSACPNVVGELFLNGSEPVQADTLYRIVQVNRETGRLATVFTPPALIEEKTFLIPPPEAQEWARAGGLPQPPEEYDPVAAPEGSRDASIQLPGPFAFVRGKLAISGSAGGEGFVSYRLQVGQGLNPQSWLQIGEDRTQAVQDGLLGEWDTRGLDGLQALRLEVAREDQRVDIYTVQVSVDNSPPDVRVIFPESDRPLDSGAVVLQVEASDNVAVTRVEWFVDGVMVGRRPAQPYSLPWSARPGRHTLTVKTFDAAGNTSETQPLSFEVK